ncbi:hypothetical protein IKQ26_01905 [bacterium]|nr:hypothetical protein [bacterium]
MQKANEEKLKRVHLTLLASDLEEFRKQCKENFSTISAELKRLIRKEIQKSDK